MFFSSSTMSNLAIVGPRRQFHRKFAPAGGTLRENPAAMGLDDILDDRQSQTARTGLEAVGAPLRETLEDMIADLRRDTRSAVAHYQPHPAPRALRGDRDRAAARRVAERVTYQVGHHPRK